MLFTYADLNKMVKGDCSIHIARQCKSASQTQCDKLLLNTFRLGENLVSTGKLFQSVIAEFTKERLTNCVMHLLDSRSDTVLDKVMCVVEICFPWCVYVT